VDSYKNTIVIKSLGLCQYENIWHKMQVFTQQRTATTIDELWLLQHYPVFTLGQAGLEKHILQSGNIPVIRTDRGGQVTYHGPGQLIMYLLSDLRRKKLIVSQIINSFQHAVIALLDTYNILANKDHAIPGVYVDKAKICSIGIKIHKGCMYHGLSLNVDMDLEPFTRINPCGQENLMMTQLKDLHVKDNLTIITNKLTQNLMEYLNYENIQKTTLD
jgi:lipoyl(octanoyl) transferase